MATNESASLRLMAVPARIREFGRESALLSHTNRIGEVLTMRIQSLALCKLYYGAQHPILVAEERRLADAYLLCGLGSQAQDHAARALLNAELMGDAEAVIALNIVSGKAYLLMKDSTKALEKFDSALKLNQQRRGLYHTSNASLLSLKASAFRALGQDQMVVEMHLQVWELLERLVGPDHVDLIEVHLELGRAYYDNKDYVRCREHLTRVVALAKQFWTPEAAKSQDPDKMVKDTLSLAGAYCLLVSAFQNDPNVAQEDCKVDIKHYVQRALSLYSHLCGHSVPDDDEADIDTDAKRAGNSALADASRKKVMWLLWELASLHIQNKDADAALKELLSLLQLQEQDTKDMGHISLDIAKTHEKLGDVYAMGEYSSQSLQAYMDALRIRTTIKGESKHTKKLREKMAVFQKKPKLSTSTEQMSSKALLASMTPAERGRERRKLFTTDVEREVQRKRNVYLMSRGNKPPATVKAKPVRVDSGLVSKRRPNSHSGKAALRPKHNFKKKSPVKKQASPTRERKSHTSTLKVSRRVDDEITSIPLSCQRCGRLATIECPKCAAEGLDPSYFCSQRCFRKAWPDHRDLHFNKKDRNDVVDVVVFDSDNKDGIEFQKAIQGLPDDFKCSDGDLAVERALEETHISDDEGIDECNTSIDEKTNEDVTKAASEAVMAAALIDAAVDLREKDEDSLGKSANDSEEGLKYVQHDNLLSENAQKPLVDPAEPGALALSMDADESFDF